jgi:hypothetical protein
MDSYSETSPDNYLLVIDSMRRYNNLLHEMSEVEGFVVH